MTEESNKAPTDLHWSLTHIDLLSERYGGQALTCNDEFFAGAANLVKRSEPIFLPDEYTDRGKWMDGWETRRRRTVGYDWCILRMGLPGTVRAFNVDTTFFRGNAPASVEIESCYSDTDPNENTQWHTLVPKIDIMPHQHNWITLSGNESHRQSTWTHLRLKIHPDGGVARLRAWGEPKPNWSQLMPGELVDLAACVNGGRAIQCSDMFFSPMNNLIAPGHGVNMGDGWETRRRRGPGHDWLIVQLACPGSVQRVMLDTRHFKGNYPDHFSLQGCTKHPADGPVTEPEWVEVISATPLQAHREHWFQQEIKDNETVFQQIRLNIYPDGGVSRLRVFGYPKTGEANPS